MADALAAGTKALAEYNEAGMSFVPSELSFSDFLDLWMDTYCSLNMKEITLINYKKKIRLHIKPALGMYKLKALSPVALQDFINKKAKQNYSRNTLTSIKGILSGSLRYVVKQELIRHNPMTNVTLPSPRNEKLKPRTDPHVYIPPDRIKQIFERFPEGSSTHIPMMLGYKGGLFNSFRTIDLDTECMDLLRREKFRQDKAKLYYKEFYTHYHVDGDRLLNSDGNGTPTSLIMVREDGKFIFPRTMQHTSQVIHYQLDYMDFDFHSLRHTHASMLAENNVPPKYLQDRLGHKNLEVTMRFYLHLTEKMQEKGSDILEKMFVSNNKESED